LAQSAWQPEASQQQQQPMQQQPVQQLAAVDAYGTYIVSDMGSAALSVLPSLVLIGLFFLHVLVQLESDLDSQPQLFEGDEQEQQPSLIAMCTAEMMAMADIVHKWLQVHSTHLAAAEYPLDLLVQQLQPWHAESLPPTPDPSSSSISEQPPSHSSGHSTTSSDSGTGGREGQIYVSMEQVRLTGLALGCMAVPSLCNNPGCTNTSGPTELVLVSGRSCVCGGCRVAQYCCRACQSQHWKLHKPVCRALAAAAAAAAPAAVAESAAVADTML
jgi:hypothetical protein